MVNGLGGTPISELYLCYGRAHKQLADRGIDDRPQLRRRVLHLARHGRRVSITLVRLDDEIERLLNEPAEIAIRVF